MRTRSYSLAILSLLTVTLGTGHAGNAPSVPVACLTYPVTNETMSSFGVPVLDLPKFTGFASAVASNTLTTTSVTWTANQYVTAGPHFVTIRTGAQAGRTLRVTANTTNTLTLDIEDTALNIAGFAVISGSDAFELYAGDTLGTLFGSAATGGILTSGIKGGTSTADADIVYVPVGAGMNSYYFSTTLGFWVLDGSATNQNGVILYPDDGYLIYRNGPTGNLTMLGRVPSTKLLSKFPGGSTNFISVRFPADTTLGGLNFGTPGSWITGTSDLDADTVSVWVPSGWYWQMFFKNSSNQWIEVGGTGTDQSSVAIPMGTAMQIQRKGTATGSTSFFSQTLPYGL